MTMGGRRSDRNGDVTADEFVKHANAQKTPAGRFDAVQWGVDAGYINKYQALKLLDFDTSEIDAEMAKAEHAMRRWAATNPLTGYLRVVK